MRCCMDVEIKPLATSLQCRIDVPTTLDFIEDLLETLLKRSLNCDFIGTSWGPCWDVAVTSILGNEYNFYEMSYGNQN